MNQSPKYDLFISYRRDGGVDYARMIFLELKGRGYNVFFDYNSLRDGNFNEDIFSAIEESKYFILVMTDGSLERCKNEDDWVRHEIEYALSKDKAIIPICPMGSVRGFPAEMPKSFEPLRNLQISVLQMDDLFEKSFDKIIEDRFDQEFREGRSPTPPTGGVTSRIFKRVGIGIIAAILSAAAIVGLTTIRSREAEKARAEQAHQLTEKMLARAAEEKKAADAAREKANSEAAEALREKMRLEAEAAAKEKASAELKAAQEEKMQLEAEAAAKEKSDAELRAAREAQIRAEAESSAVKTMVGGSKPSTTVTKLIQEEKELQENLSSLKSKELELTGEVRRLEDQIASAQEPVFSSDPDVADRQSSSWRSRVDGYWYSLRTAQDNLERLRSEKEIVSGKLAAVHAAKERIESVDKAYHTTSSDPLVADQLAKAKDELDRLVARLAARRSRVETLGGAGISADRLLAAKQLDAIAAAEHGSLHDALEKTKAADAAYGDILNDLIVPMIAERTAAINNMPDWNNGVNKWDAALKAFHEILVLDPDNENARKAYNEIQGRVNPSMTVTAELDGKPIPDVRFFVDGEPVSTPFHFVFQCEGGSTVWGMSTDQVKSIDAVYANGGKTYSARLYRPGWPDWLGETNIVLHLRETPSPGTRLRLKVRREHSPHDWSNAFKKAQKYWDQTNEDSYVTFVWCPPGTDVVKYVDPETDEEKTVVKSMNVGFWISETELTGAQFKAIRYPDECLRGTPPEEFVRLPTNDLPINIDFGLFESTMGALQKSMIRGNASSKMRKVVWLPADFGGDGAVLDIPTVAQWVHAANYGGLVDEDDFSEYAWSMDDSGSKPHPVGKKKASPLGLYDIYGNVSEWVHGSVYEWLGLREADPFFVDVQAGRWFSALGGGYSNDYEESTDLLLHDPYLAFHGDFEPDTNNHKRREGKAGIRLVALSMFEQETSLLEWVAASDLLDSTDSEKQKQGMELLLKFASESSDSELRDRAIRKFIRRGGNPHDIKVALTPALRRFMVGFCKDEKELARLVLEDEDESVREMAFNQMENPSPEVAAHYLVGVDDSSSAMSLFSKHFEDTKVDEKLYELMGRKAVDSYVRRESVRRASNPQFLKEVALSEDDLYIASLAISRIANRLTLMEIRDQSTKKKVKGAVRDRLRELDAIREREEAAEIAAKEQIDILIPQMIAVPGKKFKMSKFEVTQALWEPLMGDNPSANTGSDLPVERVSWNDCQKFLEKLNAHPSVKALGMTFRLPTEEEWEFACRAGSQGKFGNVSEGQEGSLDKMGWYEDNSEIEQRTFFGTVSAGKTHPVGQKEPNAFGLYDMHGNVAEWTSTCGGGEYALRGGCWSWSADRCTSDFRYLTTPDDKGNCVGFRLAVSVAE